jgi:hypothetical protein
MSKAQTVLRDVPDARGGARGFVNTAHYTHCLSGKFETALEWCGLYVLDNRSDDEDGNTGLYAQVNKFSTGASFAAVSEASDTTGLGGALVAHEFDSWVTGPDNGVRIGLEIVNGDARFIRGMGKSDQAVSTAAIRIGQTTSTPWAKWSYGIQMNGNIDHPFELRDPRTGAVVFEIKPNGEVWSQGRKL